MPRFFTGEVHDGLAVITGEDARHMALALRMKTGELVTVCDSTGSDYQCRITNIHPEQVRLCVEAVESSKGEPDVEITLYQALPKGDKLETIIQKTVELGVSRIVPVLTNRCISRPDEKTAKKKLERYHRISLEAAKQCGRGRIPEVESLIDFKTAVERMKRDSLAILFYENAQNSLKGTLAERLGKSVSILVGSEGGFEPSEAAHAAQSGLLSLSLGNRILRCETAPLAAVTAILYEAGEL
ncbi:MAG: 16S rRNA (uracil(1498)-N(3))-methyltransferase [Ruminococcaceae bacterium]|jgi:16S rRNA (uracil1498-N3)-methyltransferase|nr:16S rRNA (uracil(1498)-N(3))-methyltransferase [Oscillospiraceae bacterium]